MRVFILAAAPVPIEVLRSLTALGMTPIVAVPRGESGCDGAIELVHVGSRGDPSRPKDLRWSRRALRIAIREAAPELIHLHADPWTPTAEAGAAAARSLGIPYVLWRQSPLDGHSRGVTARWQAARIQDGAVALGGAVRQALDAMDAHGDTRPVAVIPAGGLVVPAQATRDRNLQHSDVGSPTTGSIVYATAGRLIPEHGVDLVLEALGNVREDWRLLVAGTGPSQPQLEEQAQRLGLSARIEWLGALPRDQLTALWQGVDVVVAPSRTTADWFEPSGRVVLQAMAHGVAPVVSRCGALPEVVGPAGLIVAESDVSALARALERLAHVPGEARALGLAARRRTLEEFTDRSIASRMAEWWRAAHRYAVGSRQRDDSGPPPG